MTQPLDNCTHWPAHFAADYAAADVARLELACRYAQDKSLGEPGIDLPHARAVVELLGQVHMDMDTLLSGFISSLDADIFPLAWVKEHLGEAVASLVEGVRKMPVLDIYGRHSGSAISHAEHVEGLRKLLLGMAEDIRVVFIKLAERVQIMRECKKASDAERRRVAQETMDIFAPLANRLGIWQLKWELEDLSFRYLEPDTYMQIAKLLDERRVDRERYIQSCMDELRQAMDEMGIQGEVTGRPKHIYSIWRKMRRKGMNFHALFDVRAVRVLVNTVAECYAVLGIVHSRWQPVRGEFDDYIASPKENMYQSLHTAVVGPEGKTLEIQIRTYDMHQHSEFGVAAHWGYKEGGQQDAAYGEKIAWLRQILEWKDEEGADEDFIDRFKSEVFQDRVYVLSPQGKVVDLPSGATPLDFAYHIHTSVGHRYRGAKVDGRIVPINYELQNGQQVEILTGKQENPSRDWLSSHLGYLKSSRARSKVRTWFRQQDQERNIADGRAILERELHRLSLTDVNLERLAKQFQYESLEAFLNAIGCGDITSAQVAGALNKLVFKESAKAVPSAAPAVSSKPSRADKGKSGVHVMGVGDLMTHMARCCKPVPNDPIMGYITQGRGVTIHRSDCPNLLRLRGQQGERFLEVEWSQGVAELYTVDIFVRAYDRQGLLRDITEVLSSSRLNVLAVNTLTDRKTGIANMTLTLEVSDVEQLSRALVKIDQLPNVMEARRKRA